MRYLEATRVGISAWLLGTASLAVAAPPPGHKVSLNFDQLDSIHISSDPNFISAFGAGRIQGEMGSILQFDGQQVPNPNPTFPIRFVYLKFFNLNDDVRDCISRATAAAGLMETQRNNSNFSPNGRNTTFDVDLSGDINLNIGGNTVLNPGDLAVVEIHSVRTATCQMTTYIPY
jgi:hypothetical protein